MATPINAPLTSEIWHLSIEDLLEPISESPRLGGAGPFVINLSASSAPLSQPAKSFVPPAGAYVYQIQRTEDRRPRYRLRLGPFATEDQADAVLGVVRDVYPSALTATAESDDLRTIATLKHKPEKPPVSVSRPAAAAAAAAMTSAAAPVAASQSAAAPPPSAPAAPVSAAPVPAAVAPVPVAPVVQAPVERAAPTSLTPIAAMPTTAVPAAPVPPAARTAQSVARPVIPTLAATPVAPTSTPVRSAAPVMPRAAQQTARSEFMPAAVTIPVLSDSVEPLPAPVRRTTPPPSASPPAAVSEPVTPAAAIDAASKAAPPSTVKPATPAAAVVPAARRPEVRDARPPSLESTQTLRALTASELKDSAARWYVIQLSLSSESFDPDSLPNLDIFNEYRLYSVAGLDQGRIVHSLRLGFFAEEGAAGAVASYLSEFYEKPTVRRISVAERERFRDQRVEARKDIGATGRHAVIEITGERHIRDNRPRISTVTPLAPAAAVSKSSAPPARKAR